MAKTKKKTKATAGKTKAKATKSQPKKAAPAKKVAPKKKAARPVAVAARAKKAPIAKPAKAKPVAIKAKVAPVPVVAAPVVAPKPVKSQIRGKRLAAFRKMLLEKRAELLGDVDSIKLGEDTSGNLSNLPLHMADVGTDNYEHEFSLRLADHEIKLLKEIDHALRKIDAGVFGICEGTQKPIALARLELYPWARFSVEYQSKLEKGQVRIPRE